MRSSGVLLIILQLAACGGGGGGGQPISLTHAVPDAAIGGLYDVNFTAVDGSTGDAKLAVSESGEFWFFEDPTAALDGLYLHGNFTVTGNSFTATGLQIAPSGFVFILDNGQQVANVAVSILNGVVSSTGDLTGDWTVDGIAGTGSFQAIASQQQSQLYKQDSSPSLIAGRYLDIRTGTLIDVMINVEGNINGNVAGAVACTISGNVSPIDSRFNLYEFQLTVAGCPNLISGVYAGAAFLDEGAGNPILMAVGDNDVNALFVYILDEN